jgi:hypothetical protein
VFRKGLKGLVAIPFSVFWDKILGRLFVPWRRGRRAIEDLPTWPMLPTQSSNRYLIQVRLSGSNQGMTLASAMWDLMHGNVPVAALGKTLGGAALGRGLMSAPVQAYLKNQRFAAAPINPQGVALPAFLANQGILAQLPYLGQ